MCERRVGYGVEAPDPRPHAAPERECVEPPCLAQLVERVQVGVYVVGVVAERSVVLGGPVLPGGRGGAQANGGREEMDEGMRPVAMRKLVCLLERSAAAVCSALYYILE